MSYVLGDHLGGDLYDGSSTSGAGGPYGLRFDDFTPPAGDGPTYSVGGNLGGLGGLTTLSWDDANVAAGAVISGTMWNNQASAAWTVTFNLTGVASDGSGGITATGGNGSMTDGVDTVVLTGKQDLSGFAFIFAADGHRLTGDSTTFVGRGWLEGGGIDDWLVVAVPIPAAAWLFGSALGLLVWTRRRAT
ncbi:MAG: hypothetical protein HKN81_12270 [Gammaproteobacteria bacterium]|nr:hypothetical protein [Gammaproteobacteria bacterium]